MSSRERTGHRDLTYSRWHREGQLKRFVGDHGAFLCGNIDIDSFEYCRFCYQPLALVETARQSTPKDANATCRLGMEAGIPVYSLAFGVDDTEQRCVCGHIIAYGDITWFKVRALWPEPPLKEPQPLTPKQWADWLIRMREQHWPYCSKNPKPIDWTAIYSFGVEAA